MDQRFETMQKTMDQRFEAVDRRFEAVDRRFETMQTTMNQRFSRQTTMMTIGFLVIATLISIYQFLG